MAILQCTAAEYADGRGETVLPEKKIKKVLSKKDLFNLIPELLNRPISAKSAQQSNNANIVAALSLMQQNIDTLLFDSKTNPDELTANSSIFNDMERLLRRTDPESASQIDNDTIDIIKMMFDIIFEDDRLPNQLKVMLARLQIPLLKVAVIDSNYFGDNPHPADQLINKLTDAALELNKNENGNFESFFNEVNFIVMRILSDFTDDTAIFSEVMKSSKIFREKIKSAPLAKNKVKSIQSLKDTTEKLKNLSQQIEKTKTTASTTNKKNDPKKLNRTVKPELKQVKQIKQPAKQIKPAQKLAVKKIHNIHQLIANAIRTTIIDYNLPKEVRDFLTTTWVNVASNIYDTHGQKSENWNNTMKVVDDLAWVFQPKTTRQDKAKLSNLVPQLITSIQDGLTSTSSKSDSKSRIFTALLSIHASNLKDQRLNKKMRA